MRTRGGAAVRADEDGLMILLPGAPAGCHYVITWPPIRCHGCGRAAAFGAVRMQADFRNEFVCVGCEPA
jgi:hypothetical protein